MHIYICIQATSLEVELGRDQGAAFLGRRGGKNWGEFLATPIWGENRQLHVYLRNKEYHMKRDNSRPFLHYLELYELACQFSEKSESDHLPTAPPRIAAFYCVFLSDPIFTKLCEILSRQKVAKYSQWVRHGANWHQRPSLNGVGDLKEKHVVLYLEKMERGRKEVFFCRKMKIGAKM